MVKINAKKDQKITMHVRAHTHTTIIGLTCFSLHKNHN